MDDDNAAFLTGYIHSDATVIPRPFRQEVLASYANYIEIGPPTASTGGLPHYENTFVLSSWVPAAVAGEPDPAHRRPMLVTYDLAPDKKLDDVLGQVDNSRAHPPSVINLALHLSFGWCRVDTGRLLFCGSYTTPGNGHDLSLLSSLAAATLWVAYPLP